MASLHYHSVRKSLLICLVLCLSSSLLLPTLSHPQGRRLLGLESEVEEKPIKKTNSSATKNQTKAIKPTTTAAHSDISSSTSGTLLQKPTLKKLNSTSKNSNSTKLSSASLNSSSKSSNSTKVSSTPTKKPLDLSKPATPKNKTQSIPVKTKSQNIPPSATTTRSTNKPKLQAPTKKIQKPIKPNWMEFEDEEDFVSEFRDLPSKFQKTLLPDLKKISTTSRAYINQANREISEGFRPLVGKQYAPTIASVISCIFIFIPLLLVSLVFHRIKAHFSLQKILIFIQIYLSIYFSILCFASLATGLEPLKFFYASSQTSYICLQVLQTLCYVFYLLLLVMYMVLVYSTDTGLGLKILGLGQTVVGFAVGLHYYVAVFHRAVLHQAPKTNWKIHGVYAISFFVICVVANAERRKKAYLEDGGEEGKKS